MENEKRKLCTSETEFFYSHDDFNAFADTEKNTIEIGKEIFTLESLLHELSEIDIEIALNMCNEKNNRITLHNDSKTVRVTQNIGHFLSPFGEYSLLNPSKARYREIPENEEFLI